MASQSRESDEPVRISHVTVLGVPSEIEVVRIMGFALDVSGEILAAGRARDMTARHRRALVPLEEAV